MDTITQPTQPTSQTPTPPTPPKTPKKPQYHPKLNMNLRDIKLLLII